MLVSRFANVTRLVEDKNTLTELCFYLIFDGISDKFNQVTSFWQRFEPVICDTTDAIMIKFDKQDFMANCVKGLLKVNKNPTSKLTFVKRFSNALCNVNQGVDS